MARHRNTLSAEFIPLNSRATSPSGSTLNPSREESAVHEAPFTVGQKALDHRKQAWSLLLPQIIRWLGTVIFSVLFVSVLSVYDSKGNFSRNDKNAFNVIVTGLSVGLAFKESAKALRWRILADERHNVREVDLVLAIESLWKVFLLARESIPSRPWTIIACVVWITLNLTAQISVALVTLTFDMVDGKSFNDTYTESGIVNASYLECYEAGENPYACSAGAYSRAHIYGEKGQSTCGLYKSIDEVVKSEQDHVYYCSQNATNPEFAYRFKEYNPGDMEATYPLFTNRTITASAGECFVYPVKNEKKVNDVEGKGPGKNFTYGSDTLTEKIQIPDSSLGWHGTTYMYKGFQAPEDTENRCGPRCMWLWAFKNGGPSKEINDREPPTFYKCPITISEVSNVSNDSQIIPNEVARIAAVSLALQGRWTGDPDNRNYNQYQFYPRDTVWEIHHKNTSHVGANMARFAIGSIAEMAAANSRIQVQGLVPHLGSHLEIHWEYVVPLLIGIITTHLVLFLSAILATRKFVIKDDSFLAIAHLLQPLVNDLGHEGTLLDGKELAKAIHFKSRGAEVVVGPMENQGSQDEYYLNIGETVKLRRDWPKHRHPAGNYI
ncbi:MAG: hypothetical protein Q9226_008494 [Calogaya cf. arnoldii]